MSSAWAPFFSMFKRLFYWRTWFDILFFSKYLILIHWPIATISLRPRSLAEPHIEKKNLFPIVCLFAEESEEKWKTVECLKHVWIKFILMPKFARLTIWHQSDGDGLSLRTSPAMESGKLAYGNVAIRRKTTFSFFPTSIRSSFAFPLRHFRSKSAGNQKTPAEREEKCKAC